MCHSTTLFCSSLAKSEPACLLPEFKFDTALETETSSNGDKVWSREQTTYRDLTAGTASHSCFCVPRPQCPNYCLTNLAWPWQSLAQGKRCKRTVHVRQWATAINCASQQCKCVKKVRQMSTHTHRHTKCKLKCTSTKWTICININSFTLTSIGI